MKNITALLFSVLSTLVFSQKSEALIPSQSSSVFSINNLQLLEKISVDELITYDFMEDIHQELFDGSTEAKSLNDAGIDFEEVDIELVPDAAELVEKANNGNQTVPTLIFSDGTAMTNPSLASIREHIGR